MWDQAAFVDGVHVTNPACLHAIEAHAPEGCLQSPCECLETRIVDEDPALWWMGPL